MFKLLPLLLESFLQEAEDGGTISTEEAAELIEHSKTVFTVTFIKNDGSERVLNGRVGVKKHLTGGSLRYDPREKDLIPLYDMQIGMGPAGYRMLNKHRITGLKINGKIYKVEDQKQELDEIEIGITPESILDLQRSYMGPQLKLLYPVLQKRLDKVTDLYIKYGWGSILSNEKLDEFLNRLDKNQITKLYKELESYTKSNNINEIEILKITPQIAFDEWMSLVNIKGYDDTIWKEVLRNYHGEFKNKGSLKWFEKLNQQNLNRVYQDIKNYKKKYNINEIQIDTSSKVKELWHSLVRNPKIDISDLMRLANNFGTTDDVNQADDFIEKLHPGNLSKLYKELKDLENKAGQQKINTTYYQQVLDQSRLEPRKRNQIQSIINNAKKTGGLAPLSQILILQKFKTGNLKEVRNISTTKSKKTLSNLVSEIVTESRLSFLKTQLVGKTFTPEEFDQIASLKVTKPAYTEWLLNTYNKEFKQHGKNIDDFMSVSSEIINKIEYFEKNKSLFKDKDLMKYSLSDLNQNIDTINKETGPSHQALSTAELSKLAKVGIKNLGEIDGYLILMIPKGNTSNQTYNVYRDLVCAGRTHVCTASQYGRFEYYTVNDNLFMIINPEDELSPYHVAEFNKSFVDKNNKHIEDPKIWKIIQQIEAKYYKNSLNEIEIEVPYKISNWAINHMHTDWDQLRAEFGEDKADALVLASDITKDGKTIIKHDIEEWLKDDTGWTWDAQSLTDFFFEYGVLDK